MNCFAYAGRRVYYEEHGEGVPLLLLHGNTATGRMFDPIVPMFAGRFRVIVPDFLGCGRSDRLEKWPADLWFDWANQVRELCRQLGLEHISLVGSSGGALAAVNVALEYPELVGAVVADSFAGLGSDSGTAEQIRNGRLLAKKNERFREYQRSLHGGDWESVFDADTDAVLRHASEMGSYFHRQPEELRVRTLLTGSLEDEMFPKGHCELLFAEICGRTKLARAHIFEHGGHPAMLSNMEAFVKLCDSFLAEAGENPVSGS